MVVEDQQIVSLKNDFYRDGYRKVILCGCFMLAAMGLLIASSIYLYVTKPPPVYFVTDREWRTVPPVPVDLPYLSQSDLLQWAGDVLQSVFNYDFINYEKQLKEYRQYFTQNGWLAFQGMLNNYASSQMVVENKTFVNGSAAGAPFILNEGLLDKTYAWWVQMPITIKYIKSTQVGVSQEPIFQILVVRIPTANNLFGVAIDNIRLLTVPVKGAAG